MDMTQSKTPRLEGSSKVHGNGTKTLDKNGSKNGVGGNANPIMRAEKPKPKKGSFAEIMSRAASTSTVGMIQHKRLTPQERREQRRLDKLRYRKGKAIKPTTSKVEPTKPAVAKDTKDNKENAGKKSSLSGPAYKGTARPKKEVNAYKGTAHLRGTKLAAGTSANNRSRSSSSGPSRDARYAKSSEEEEDDEDDYESDASSDMEADPMELEFEERKATRIALKEDEDALREEERLRREKEARRKRLGGLAAKHR